MDDSRIIVSTEELAKSFAIWLTVVGQRRPSLLRDLWTRKGERANSEKRDHARHELARFLAEQMRTSDHQVVRRETSSDRVWASVRENEG